MLLSVVLGAVIGVVLALTGAGGGILAMPLLMLALHLPPQQAAPVSLIAIGLAAGVGSVLGLREGIVRYRAALMIGIMGMVSAPLGVWLSARVPARPLLLGLAALLTWVAWQQWRQASGPTSRPDGPQPPCVLHPQEGRLIWTSPCAQALAGTGLLSGLLSGLAGVGGGFIIIPSLARNTDLDWRQIQATALSVIALVALSGVSAAAIQGHVPLQNAGPFALGTLASLLLTRRWAQRLPVTPLRRTFAALCAVSAGLLVFRGLGWL